MHWLLAMVARSLCDVIASHAFTLLVSNRSETAITKPKNMTIAQSSAFSDVLWPIPVYGENENMSQRYIEADTEEQKLKRRYAVARQDVQGKVKR